MLGLRHEWTASYNATLAMLPLSAVYRSMSRAKFVVALSSSWLSAGQVIDGRYADGQYVVITNIS